MDVKCKNCGKDFELFTSDFCCDECAEDYFVHPKWESCERFAFIVTKYLKNVKRNCILKDYCPVATE